MKINCSQKLGTIQAVLQTLSTKSQNTNISTTIYRNEVVVFFYRVYRFSHRRRAGIRVFYKNITTFNLLMWLLFTMADIILN